MAEKQEHVDKIEEKPLNKEQVEQKYKDKSFTDKLWHIKDNITVEPLLAGMIIPSVISRFAMTNFNLDKACRVYFEFEDHICDALIKKNSNNYSTYEKEVQMLISSIDIWKSIIHTGLPFILIMFLGAWSDRTGKRKLCIMLPIFGELLTSLNNLVNVYFFYEIPVHVTVFLETFFPAITGGWVTMFLGVFSYISDITSEKSRTFRVGLVNIGMTVGLPIGIGFSGYLLKIQLGYYSIFSLTTVLFAAVLLYGCTCLKEPDQWLQERGKPTIARADSKGVSFFDVTHVLDTMRVAFRKRPSNRRVKVLLTLVAVFILFGPSMSEYNVFYLFVRNQLNWTPAKYSFYASYSIVLHSIGTMFSITVLSKKLQIDDSLLCFVSVFSKFVGSIWTAFVTSDMELYIIPVVELLSGTIFTSLRSILSKLVDKQETAKVNSLFSLTETLASLIFNPIYAWLYKNTLDVLPGAVFLTSAILIIPAAVILVYFFTLHRISLRKARKKALEAEGKKEIEAAKISEKPPLPENNAKFDSTRL
ncbi:proton-coupled folate transporter-like [Bicyclus anynana]|uniref:Proton-coupled folate transporter-like n=1 Tax=Bicyclus anynana TaxID=110368 RepID=A0A6J1N4N3_BICAN|nr:proton-coupled folate transporter-like [Bicyclus anynana]XP_023940049.2 proton-coupled folate transporter-like [Bicyclus anynana]XP_052738465.1 proton-coupled folate transporter-like [Bicyclus anynana]XP_052738466.1 proton-coupled folate transporter-like [Bicyclus anynana]XP_052738467.1 proton-coupled folate transporter-like [Bicyclus anynana]